MAKLDQVVTAQAIAEAMTETVHAFGISFVRTLTFFPSASKVAVAEAA